jgi:L-2-hydroxyglutarate oxidase LhgO
LDLCVPSLLIFLILADTTSSDKEKENAIISKFHQAAQRYLPGIDISRMYPDFTGIRPKIAPNDGKFKDFILNEESKNGFPGLVNLIGIESPGLTSSLSLADQVAVSLGYPSREWE